MKLALSSRTCCTNEQIEMLTTLGYQVNTFSEILPQNFSVFVGYPEIIRDNPSFFTKDVEYIHLLSAGFEKIDVKEMMKHGVRISNSRGVYSIPIAEYVTSKILLDIKNEELFRKQQAAAKWYRFKEMKEVNGTVVGFLGTGDIAQTTAKYLKSLGVKILGLNTNGHSQRYFDRTFCLSEIDLLLSQCEYVVNTLPLNQQTYHILNKERLFKMKKDGVLINVGRGKTIAENELREVLDIHLKKVYADVFEHEPLPETAWQWSHPKMQITPHVSFASTGSENRKRKLAIANLVAFSKAEKLKNELS